MTTTNNRQLSADERRELFVERFDWDIDAPVVLSFLVNEAGRYLSRIIPSHQIEAGMRVMLKCPSWSLPKDDEWDDKVLGDTSIEVSGYPLARELESLACYALFGIYSPPQQSQANQDPEQHLGEILDRAKAVVSESPLEQWMPDSREYLPLVRVVMLADNRWNLDHGLPVEPDALAYFGGVTPARVRNLMSGPDRKFTSHNGRVPAQQALDWLADRDTFFDSIWRVQPKVVDSVTQNEVNEPLFVPVARDKSIFHPGLARANGFTIGPKGAERHVSDYHDALTELQRMPIPYWRRPNEKGKYGIVRGVEWERHDSESLAARTI